MDKRRETPDHKVTGLYKITQPSGKQSWAFRYRFQRKNRKLTLGPFPLLDLAAARARAIRAATAVLDGRDPAAEKVAARRASAEAPPSDEVEHVVKQFISYYCKRHLRPRTAQEVERLLTKEIVPVWQGRSLAQIGRPDVNELLDRIVERGAPAVANSTLSWTHRLCAWSAKQGILATNPCAGIEPPAPTRERDRLLPDSELAAIWKAAEGLERPYEALIKLLILTGARRQEIANMRWSELNFEDRAEGGGRPQGGVWVLPKERSKNNHALVLPLPAAAVDILARLRASESTLPRVGPGDFVLTTTGRNPISAFSVTKKQLDARLPTDMEPWVIHDLRRAFASGCARLGVGVHVVEAVLNHRSGTIKGIARVYNRYSYEVEKRHALELWARHIATIVTGEASENVLEMRRLTVRN